MPSTMAYRQGDIVLVSFPFTDLTSSKRRPALILSPDSFNAAGEDLVLAAVTSHITDDPNAVHLWRGGRARSARAGLKTPKQKNPARVLLTDAEYEALLKAALLMDWRFRVALVIAHETGRRVGAIRQLCWSDIDMEGRTIRWRTEHEKTGHEHRTPVTAAALDAPTPNVPARTRTWGLLLRRRTKGDANQGKKSAKSNWDCTICRSCRWGVLGSNWLKKRENWVKWRGFAGAVADSAGI